MPESPLDHKSELRIERIFSLDQMHKFIQQPHTPATIEIALGAYPNAHLTVAPTPVYRLTQLSKYLAHNIFVKREDLTGFALGGNKVRKLDYLIADAMAKQCDTLVTRGANSFSRNAASAGRVFGLNLHVFVSGSESEHNIHSQQHFRSAGATLHYLPQDTLDERYHEFVKELQEQGRQVYELHPGGSDQIGALGYINAFAEIENYTKSTGVQFQKIIIPSGSTGTQVGMMLGQNISAYQTQIIGITISQNENAQKKRIEQLAIQTANMLGVNFDKRLLILDDRFLGDGYPIPSTNSLAAVELFAQSEGLLLDGVYVGKAAAGLMHYCKQHELDESDNILFVLTGGNGGLYY